LSYRARAFTEKRAGRFAQAKKIEPFNRGVGSGERADERGLSLIDAVTRRF
jgi:hypothetical protein